MPVQYATEFVVKKILKKLHRRSFYLLFNALSQGFLLFSTPPKKCRVERHGAIKIDKEGFKSTFSSVVEDDSNEEFLVDYTRRVEDENILKALKKKKDKSDILNYNDKYYYRVNAEGNTKYFYEADSIMEEDSQDDEEN